MPLFEISGKTLQAIEQTNFALEKELQRLIESNLETVFNCKMIASEFSTGAQHAGRIDSLALSEDNNPVIIEYKKVESSELINQSLYYLYWIQDHKGDFEIAVQKTLGSNIEVDWSDIRVICIAPNYKKYDLHAVQVMGANIELWKYRLFRNSSIYFEEVFQSSISSPSPAYAGAEKNPVMVAAGKKAAQTRATASYTFDEHLEGKAERIQEWVYTLREYILGLDVSIEEAPKKFYIAYKISQNIVCMEIQTKKILLYLKLKPADISSPHPDCFKDVSNIGHYGTGDVEFCIKRDEDIEIAKPFIEIAYQKVGG